MKYIAMMMLSIGVAFGASASQLKVAGRVAAGSPGKVVVVRSYGYRPYGFGYGYNPFFNPYFGYNAFYGPYGYYRQRPTKLDLDIQQVENDYHHDIVSARHDKTLSAGERRQKIRDLKHERENSIIETKKEYYASKNKMLNKR